VTFVIKKFDWVTIPNNETKVYGELWDGVLFEASPPEDVDTWRVNDTTNFQINSTGFLSWTDYLDVDEYYVNVTVNNTYGKTIWTIYNLNITQKSLDVTADDKSKIYGDAEPTYTASYSGFVLGEDESVLGGTLSFDRDEGEAVGTYNITPSGLTSTNYDISFINGTLTITQASPTLDLLSSAGWTLVSADYSNITGVCPEQLTCNAYENNVLVTLPYFKMFPAGSYTFVYNTTGNHNYTAGTISKILKSEIAGVKETLNDFGYNYLNKGGSQLR